MAYLFRFMTVLKRLAIGWLLSGNCSCVVLSGAIPGLVVVLPRQETNMMHTKRQNLKHHGYSAGCVLLRTDILRIFLYWPISSSGG